MPNNVSRPGSGTTDTAALSEAELHAYADGRLEPDRRAAVEAYLAQASEVAQRLREDQHIAQGLHQLFDGVLAEPIPDRLWQAANPRHRPRLGWRVAAAIGWLALGGMLGWFAHDHASQRPAFISTLVQQALVAHAVYSPEVRHPVEVNAAQEEHLVAWLSKRLGTTLRAPRLSALGYELLGGRLLPADDGPAAQFMYQDGQGRRLTLFVRRGSRNPPDTAFHFAEQDGMRAFYWLDGDLGYALIGTLDKVALVEVAHAVYQQLNR